MESFPSLPQTVTEADVSRPQKVPRRQLVKSEFIKSQLNSSEEKLISNAGPWMG
jgi:hypothetical protein